jgi:hypothetical protein
MAAALPLSSNGHEDREPRYEEPRYVSGPVDLPDSDWDDDEMP